MRGEMGGTCPRHYPHLPPGGPGRPQWGRRAWGGGGRAPGGGARTPRQRLSVSGSRAQRVRPQVRAAGRAGPRGGSFLAEKGVIVCSYSWYVRRARRPRAAGEPLPGAPRERRRPGERRREGCGLGGASPRGGAPVQAGSAGAGAWPGPRPLVDGGISWPRQSHHKGGCGRGALGSCRGADGSGDSAAPGGLGRGHFGEGGDSTATFEVQTVVGAARRLWSPCQAARVPADLGSFTGV